MCCEVSPLADEGNKISKLVMYFKNKQCVSTIYIVRVVFSTLHVVSIKQILHGASCLWITVIFYCLSVCLSVCLFVCLHNWE